MSNADTLIDMARTRAKEADAPYCGILLPAEAHALLQQREDTVLVDVRTRAERDWVGFVPDSVHVEWLRYPGGARNESFLDELRAAVPQAHAVMFLCRSGARSDAAARLAVDAGYPRAFNILNGFEGDRDAQGHRNTLGGWRHDGLPWQQG